MLERAALSSEPVSISEAGSFIAYDVLERRISEIPGWPIDMRMLGWLSAVFLSLLTTLLGRLLLNSLNL
jgi:hypothetical protein